MSKRKAVLLGFLGILNATLSFAYMGDSNYSIPVSIFSQGGEVRSFGNYTITDVVGQGIAGVSQDGNRTISSNFFYVSSIQIVATITAGELGKVVVYPNPFKPNSGLGHNVITFGHPTDISSQLTKEATIRIYTIAGELVKTIEEIDGDGVAVWHADDDSGNKVASGIYIYLITNPKGEKCIGKIGIIK